MLGAVLVTCLAAAGPDGPAAPGAALSFERDIRPILADACYRCHGPDGGARKAGLRLDLREGLFGPTRDASDPARDPSLPAVVVDPSRGASSELARRISSPDPDERMPPAGSIRPLSDPEIARLMEWIERGAPWTGHWSFEPIRAPEPPADVPDAGVRNDIDRFVLRELASRAVTPAPDADPRTLLRRVSLDLTGLPPTKAEIDGFVADASPDAYERRVDRLLASPRYGRHMALKWLEIARYADSNGFQLDLDRTAWPWRDWVVDSFNANMPFDEFTIDQLAGDLLPDATTGQILATAFNRNHPINGEGGREIEESRIDYVHDRVDATATTWLGLTFACAQCHDHKYDPIPQRDYYGLFAFFNSVDETGAGDKGDEPPLLEYTDGAGRELNVMVMRDRATARTTHVLRRGAWDDPGEEVQPTTPSALPGLDGAPRNRLGLARWIVNPANPLTARVAVNRLWQQVFGTGLVRTPDNFGAQGERPALPELLDWLADRYIRSGWDTKALLRLIVTSSTYRRSSAVTPSLLDADPENRYLSRSPRYRLPSPVIRDQALYAAGLLVERDGGPPVRPYHPGGVWEDVSFGRLTYRQDSGDDLYRPSLHTFWRRTAAPANMFDVSARQKCSVRVIRTNTPLQALILMNDPTFAEASAAFAERSIRDGGGTDASRLAWAFESLLCRPPSDAERRVLDARLAAMRNYFAKHLDEASAAACAGERPDPPADQRAEIASLGAVMTVILNLDETLTRE